MPASRIVYSQLVMALVIAKEMVIVMLSDTLSDDI